MWCSGPELNSRVLGSHFNLCGVKPPNTRPSVRRARDRRGRAADNALSRQCGFEGPWQANVMGNPVIHVELIGPDPARLRDFYAQLFGWHADPGAPVAERISLPTEYSFITPAPDAPSAAGGIGGGPQFEAHAIFYVGVSNVADALARAQGLGATAVLPPQRNEGGGVTVAHFLDPAGNLVGIAGPE